MTAAAHLPIAEFAFPGPLRDRLVAAIIRGEKTSTSGLLTDFERDGDNLPKVGDHFQVVDSDGKPVAVIEATEVRVIRVADVDLPFALEEGEGFASVADWREAHERFWHSYAEQTRAYLDDPDWHVTDETLIVAERFRLVDQAQFGQ